MPKENKITEIEKINRVNKVYELIVKGINTTEIFQYVSEVEKWDVSERQIYNYISDAKEIFKNLSEKNYDVEFGKSISRLTLLFQKSLKIQDYKTCLQVQKEINDMFGIKEAAKIDLTSQGNEINAPTTAVTINFAEPEDEDN